MLTHMWHFLNKGFWSAATIREAEMRANRSSEDGGQIVVQADMNEKPVTGLLILYSFWHVDD